MADDENFFAGVFLFHVINEFHGSVAKSRKRFAVFNRRFKPRFGRIKRFAIFVPSPAVINAGVKLADFRRVNNILGWNPEFTSDNLGRLFRPNQIG